MESNHTKSTTTKNGQQINLTDIEDTGKNGMACTLDTSIPTQDLNNHSLALSSEKFDNETSSDIEEAQSEEDEYPEGGYGWVIVAAAFLVTFWTLGVAFLWGIFQAHFIHTDTFPGASRVALYWIGTIACSTVFLASPAIVVLIHKIGAKYTMMLGTLMTSGGFIFSSFATEFWHLYLTVSLLFGLGGCLCYFTALTVLSQYFFKKRGLVLAIALMGSGIGSTALSPLIRLMLADIGFPWTMRVLGFCMLFFLGLAALMVRPYNPVTLDNNNGSTSDYSNVSSEKGGPAKPKKNEAKNKSVIDFTLLKDKNYALVLLATALFSLIYLVPILLMPSFALSVNLRSDQGAILVSIFTGVGTITRVFVGILSDRYGVLNATIICSSITVISLFTLWLGAESYTSLITFAVVFGGFGGPSIMLYPVSASRIVPSSKLTSALGFIFMSQASGYLIGAPVSQFIVAQQNGKYEGAIIFVGTVSILSTLIAAFVRLRLSRNLRAAI